MYGKFLANYSMPKKHYMIAFKSKLSLVKTIVINLFFWLPIVFCSLLIVVNTIPYFSFSKQFNFIVERAILFLQPAYKTSFYIHIGAGMFCVIAALFQFSSYILKKYKKLHTYMGRVYVFVVLFLAAPTGLYMSFFAKGSNAEKLLFMFMAFSWFVFTLKGLTTILSYKIIPHKAFMMRSYSMALTAVTFRIYYIMLHLLQVPEMQNYQLSLWISVVGNMLLAETIIYKNNKHYLLTF